MTLGVDATAVRVTSCALAKPSVDTRTPLPLRRLATAMALASPPPTIETAAMTRRTCGAASARPSSSKSASAASSPHAAHPGPPGSGRAAMAVASVAASVVRLASTVAFSLNVINPMRGDASASGGGGGGDSVGQHGKNVPPPLGQQSPSKPLHDACALHSEAS